jgi:hypothetical protein
MSLLRDGGESPRRLGRQLEVYTFGGSQYELTLDKSKNLPFGNLIEMKAQRGRKRDGPNRRSSEGDLNIPKHWPGLPDNENPSKGIG